MQFTDKEEEYATNTTLVTTDTKIKGNNSPLQSCTNIFIHAYKIPIA